MRPSDNLIGTGSSQALVYSKELSCDYPRVFVLYCGAACLVRSQYSASASESEMSDYSGFGSSYGSRGAGGALDKGKIMERVRNQVALASAQEMIQVNINHRSKQRVKYVPGTKCTVVVIHRGASILLIVAMQIMFNLVIDSVARS